MSNSLSKKSSVLLRIILCLLVGGIGIYTRLAYPNLHPVIGLLIFGFSIVSAAFVLSWVGEALQVDLSQGLAMSILALIAVLPEYAVDLHFAYRAAKEPIFAHYAAINMTGSNRLLIGVGWSLVVLIGTWKFRKSKEKAVVVLGQEQSLEWVVLLIACLFSVILPLTYKISLWHSLCLFALFGFYTWRMSLGTQEEPHLEGVAKFLSQLERGVRWSCLAALLCFAVAVLFCAAHPFADSLVGTGKQLGVNEVILVQWLAPFASEAPEFFVAIVFTLKGQARAGLTTLISSKVNQWTLLLGSIPVAYSFGKGSFMSFLLDKHQSEELILTAAQGLLGVAFLCNGSLSRKEAFWLLILFVVQVPFAQESVRYGISIVYVVLAIAIFVNQRKHLVKHFRQAFPKR